MLEEGTMSQTANLNRVDLDAVIALVNAVDSDPQAGHTVWRADVRWEQGFRSSATVREFAPIASDEPSGLGGTDTAPNPVEQVAAALGNCLAVGYVAALTGRGIAVRELDIAVSGDLDLRPFLGLAPGHAGYSKLGVDVRIDSDADEATLQEVHRQVVATSPVGHTLSNPVEVDVRLTPSL
jgi:uncharacterized OsmC-like protein